MVDEQHHERTIGLDEDRTDTAYLLGRIIALNEQILNLGSGEHAGYRYKEIAWPSAAAGRARRAIVHGEQQTVRASKLLRHRNPERAEDLEQAKGTLFNLIVEVPEHLDQRGSHILRLGYHHQSASLRDRMKHE